MLKRTRVAFLGAAMAACLVAAACGDDDSSSSATTTGGSTATTAGGAATSGGGATTTAAKKWPAIPDGPITFGISQPLSGQGASFGALALKALTEVSLPNFKLRNPNGIAGHEVKFSAKDDAGDITTAVNVANQLVAEKVTAMVFLTQNPSAIEQQASVFNKAKVPVVSNQAGSGYTDATKWPYMFGVLPSPTQSWEAGAEWIAAHPEIKTLGVLGDNGASTTEGTNALLAKLKTVAPSVKVAQSSTITPGAVDVSTQIAQLKAANPDLLVVNIGYGFGPVWTAVKNANWAPKIMTSGGAWYDSFDAMGTLANNAVAPAVDCVKEGHPPFAPAVTQSMDGYAAIFGSNATNYLIFVQSDDIPLEMLKYAIEKNNSTDPDAIKDALESMKSQSFFDTWTYTFTPTVHFGVEGDLGPATCKLSPLTDGKYRIPVIAP